MGRRGRERKKTRVNNGRIGRVGNGKGAKRRVSVEVEYEGRLDLICRESRGCVWLE